jgi:hypothetical protein
MDPDLDPHQNIIDKQHCNKGSDLLFTKLFSLLLGKIRVDEKYVLLTIKI